MMNKLSDIVRKSMIGKKQIPGRLKHGDNFCISGLLINHFAPDIDIEGHSWHGINELVNRYPKYFSEESYYSSYDSIDLIEKYVYDFKQYYIKTKRINLKLLVSINDSSFGNGKPYTFTDFANLFEEIGIEIKIPNYKENDVITIDNAKVSESIPIESKPIVNIQLDPEISQLLSQHISKMLIKKEI